MKFLSTPSLPAERFDPDIMVDGDRGIRAWRNSPANRPVDRPDTIMVDAGNSGAGCFIAYLTPAMLVQMANTLLTDTERAAITQRPLMVALDASVQEDLITPDDRSAILSTIAGGHTE